MLLARTWAWEPVWRRLQPAPIRSSGTRIKMNQSDRIVVVCLIIDDRGRLLPRSVPTLFDVHQTTIERGTAADIGQPVRSERVDAALAGRELAPADRWRRDHARPDRPVHFRHQQAASAVIEDAYPIAIRDAARTRIVHMQKQCGSLSYRRWLIAE